MQTLHDAVKNWQNRFIAPPTHRTAVDVFDEIRRRKSAKEKPCGRCGGSGMYNWTICRGCLGQATTLSSDEWLVVMEKFCGNLDRVKDDLMFESV